MHELNISINLSVSFYTLNFRHVLQLVYMILYKHALIQSISQAYFYPFHLLQTNRDTIENPVL